MMHTFAASSLYQAIQTLPGGVNQRQSYLTVIPGLHLNKNSAKNFRNIVQFQIKLLQKKSTKRPENVIWHDAINNSLTPHSSNFYSPLTRSQLIAEIQKLPVIIKAKVYCQRESAPKIYDLLKQHFQTVHMTEDILSHRKLNDKHLLQKFRKLNLEPELALKTYLLIAKYISNLSALKSKKKRLNNKRRKTLYRRSLKPSI